MRCVRAFLSLPQSLGYWMPGCGEGYYAQHLLEAAAQRGIPAGFLWNRSLQVRSEGGGQALSEDSSAGAEQLRVGSIFDLPFADESLDVVYNVFSPIGEQEFSRVLRPGGHFVAAYPGARHLFGLKEILYEHPYENEEKNHELQGFSIQSRQRIAYRRRLDGQAVIQGLFMMTPYYYKTSVAGCRASQKAGKLGDRD